MNFFLAVASSLSVETLMKSFVLSINFATTALNFSTLSGSSILMFCVIAGLMFSLHSFFCFTVRILSLTALGMSGVLENVTCSTSCCFSVPATLYS